MVLFGGIMRRREERRVEAAKSRGWAQGFAEGWAQGFAEGLAQGREWNRRRLEAEVAGRPFTEPPPSGLSSESKTDT